MPRQNVYDIGEIIAKVSILIPTYINNKNEIKLLEYNLNQIRLQKEKDYEVIVSDDSETNYVEKYIKKIKDIDIKYIKNTGKKGIGGNSNNAMIQAKGELIHFMYQDDYFFNEQSLQKIVENFDYDKKWMVSAYIHTRNRNEFFNLHPNKYRIYAKYNWHYIVSYYFE